MCFGNTDFSKRWYDLKIRVVFSSWRNFHYGLGHDNKYPVERNYKSIDRGIYLGIISRPMCHCKKMVHMQSGVWERILCYLVIYWGTERYIEFIWDGVRKYCGRYVFAFERYSNPNKRCLLYL